MSEPFEIDTDALGRAEAPFRELAQRLVALSNQVQGQVSALGEVWGDDKAGRQFAAQYGPSRDDLLTAFRSTGDVVTSTADGVRTMAQGFRRTEESNADASSQLLQRTQAVEATPLLPTTVAGAVEGVPAGTVTRARHASVRATEPMQAARRVNVDAATEPEQPALQARAQALRAEPAAQADRGTPLLPSVGTPGVPATPVERTRRAVMPGVEEVRATRTMHVTGVPATAGVPAAQADRGTPLLPSVGTPGVPAERARYDVVAGAEPLPATPGTPLMPAVRTELAQRVESEPVRRLVDESRPTEG